MTTVNIYLIFDGNCREAFNLYHSVFGGEQPAASTFGDMPPAEGRPPMPEEIRDRIMHIELPISKETVLLGSDSGGGMSPPVEQGNNFSVSVNTDSTDEADRIFNALSEGGTITMALERTFWGSYFGMLTDRFGINWMVSCPLPEQDTSS